MRTSRHRTARWLHVAALTCLLLPAAALVADAAKSLRDPLLKLVGQVQHADYAGDRPALQKLYVEMGPYVDDKDVAASARYWRGFALWRRALNGFNDPATDPKDLEHDLTRAVEEFKATVASDPQFVDAKIGAVSCLGNLMYLSRDQERTQALLNEMLPILKEAQTAAPENPRLLWVRGPQLWYLGDERGGGEEKAFATYEKGLELVRKQKAGDPLQPSWGEAELLMNLAWSNLHRKKPDLDAADQYAHQALQIVPYWHYVRDILLPQIEQAKKAAGQHGTP